MDANPRTRVSAGLVVLMSGLACIYALFAPTIHAQILNTPTDPQLAEPGLELDIESLLTDARVFEGSIQDTIWEIRPQPGRRLIQIPVLVTPSEVETRLSTPSLKLRGGRFIAWRLLRPGQESSGFASGPGAGPGGYGPADIYSMDTPPNIGAMRDFNNIDLNRLDSPGAMPGSTIELDASEEDGLPRDIPMLARSLTIGTDGIIHWELERAIPGAEVRTGNSGYMLKLRPDRLQEMEPQRSGSTAGRQPISRQPGVRQPSTRQRVSPDEARRQAEQRRAEEMEYRAKIQAYRELRKQVMDLPEEFQMPMPERLWAVYEVPERMDELSFTGPAPLPWSIREADLLMLRQLASRSGSTVGSEGLTAEHYALISRMTLMLEDGHPLTQRLVADVLSQASLYGQAKQGDALYRLIDRLLRSSDPQAAQTTAAGLASVVPPTPATLALLKGALDQMDPASKLLALGGLLAAQDNDPAGQRQMIDTANRMIADPNGPGAVYVLEQLVESLAGRPEAAKVVGPAIRFDTLSDEDLTDVIVFVAEAAGESPLAAEWMEHGLLGSPNPTVARKTIEVLASSTASGGIVSRATEALITSVFGPPKVAYRSDKPRLATNARIPLASRSHSIFRALNAGDPELRTLGWKALRHFQVGRSAQNPAMTPPSFAGDYGYAPTAVVTEPVDESDDPMRLILETAFKETLTPTPLVAFLANQQNPGPATEGLIRVVVEGRGPAITLAANALLRSARPIENYLRALSAEQRGMFAVRLYEASTGRAPMVAGLLRVPDGNAQVVSWFARQVASNGLPAPTEWAQAVGGEEELLSLAASSDPELANAAVAALVASVGGSELDAHELTQRMNNATDRSPQGLREQWLQAKQRIYTEKLSEAAGQYKLIVNLRGQANAQPGDPYGYGAPPMPGMYPDMPPMEGYDPYSMPMDDPSLSSAPLIKSIHVAVIELVADGQSLRLASGTLTLEASPRRLAILISQPNELKDFGVREMEDLPLDSLQGPIELLPKPSGAWQGASRLSDGRVIEVVFEPTS
ncbi:MAG: hypothetical protein Kow00105_02070 [Phycisphaeraceae bacterium]